MAVALRTSLIWHDEVMKDLVAEAPTKVTLGRTGKSTLIGGTHDSDTVSALVRSISPLRRPAHSLTRPSLWELPES